MICVHYTRDRTADGSVSIPLTLVSVSYVSADSIDGCIARLQWSFTSFVSSASCRVDTGKDDLHIRDSMHTSISPSTATQHTANSQYHMFAISIHQPSHQRC
jgi:hypothetical protein